MTDTRTRFSNGQRILAGFLAWLMFFSPVIVLAEEVPRLPPAQVGNSQSAYWDAANDPTATQQEQGTAAGKFGAQVGKFVGENAVQPSRDGNGNFNLGTATDEDGAVFDVEADANSFFSGTSGQAEDPASVAFPGGNQVDIDQLKNADDDSLRSNAAGYRSSLFEDAQRDQPETVMGGAYRVLLNDANRTQPDMRNDPAFNLTRDTYTQAEGLTDEFSDCELTQQINERTEQVRVPDYKTCRRMQDKSQECTIKHEYSTAVVEVASGTNANLVHRETPNGGYYLGWIGNTGNNYWNDNPTGYNAPGTPEGCADHRQKTTYRVLNPEAITKATLVYAQFDDQVQIYVGDFSEENRIFEWPNGGFNLTMNGGWKNGSGSCEFDATRERQLDIDVTDTFKNAEPGDLVDFTIRVAVGGLGDGYARLKLDYDESKLLKGDTWVPSSPDCIESANATHDDYVGGGYECTDQPPLDGNGCMTSQQGLTVCPEDFAEPPLDINPTCKEVTVDANYSFYAGEGCFFDRDGNEICQEIPQVEGGGELTECEKYEDNPQCSYVSTECVEGTEGEDSGTCYIQNEVWDCGEFVDVTDYESEENIQCDGEFLCQGDSCGDVADTESTSFNKAAAMLQAANFMAMDGECEEVDINENRNCQVFGGNGTECKIVGLPEYGIDAVDCCDQPVEITPGQYIGMIAKTGVMDSAFMSIQPDATFGAIKGSYQTLRDPVTSAFSEVTQPFTSAAETVTGPVKDAITENLTKPVGEFLSSLKNKISKEMAKFFTEQGVQGAGQAAGGAVGGEGAAQAGGEQAAGMMGTAGNIMGAVMGAYTAVMVAYMALQIIYECTEDEIQLAVKRELKSCSRVGSYCAEEICIAPTGFGCAAYACTQTRNAYCCYNSPLSRIVMEQAAPQLGRSGRNGMGSPKNPQCGGIPLGQLEALDWDQIDLSEWTGILQQEGALKTSPADLNFEALTGSGHAFAMEDEWGERDNTIERTKDRMSNGSPDDMRIEQGQSFSFDPD